VLICPKCGKPGSLQFTHTYRGKVRYTYPAFVHYAGYRGSTRKLKVCLRGWGWFLAYRKEAVEEYYAKMQAEGRPFEMVGTWEILGIPLDVYQQADTDFWRAESARENRKRRQRLRELRPESAPKGSITLANLNPEMEQWTEDLVEDMFSPPGSPRRATLARLWRLMNGRSPTNKAMIHRTAQDAQGRW
jgi:hypothetical protein